MEDSSIAAKRFNLFLSPRDVARLDELAAQLELTKSATIRKLIREALDRPSALATSWGASTSTTVPNAIAASAAPQTATQAHLAEVSMVEASAL